MGKTKADYEDMLFGQILEDGLPEPTRQFKAIPKRAYTWDLAWPDKHILVEVHGGMWAGKSGHSTGVGVRRDAVKQSLASIFGYLTIVVTTDMVTHKEALMLIRAILLHDPADVEQVSKFFEHRSSRRHATPSLQGHATPSLHP